MEQTKKERRPRSKKEREPLCATCLLDGLPSCERTRDRYYQCRRYVYCDPDPQHFYEWFDNRPSARAERTRREAEAAAERKTKSE